MERQKLGMILIILGVLAWPVGYILNVKPIPNILFFHLLFIIPGVYLKGSKILKKIQKK